ncbi:MAG: adenosine kinase [Oligoflexus sp.]
MKSIDVVSICNALMDILVEVQESDVTNLKLRKGIMHLVDDEHQAGVASHFADHSKTEELGGSSLNAIRTLAELGAKTSFAGMIGQDKYAEQIKARMAQLGIKANLQATDKAATGSCFILITPDGERTMNTNLGASCLFDESLVPYECLEQARIFHFCGYQWGSNSQIEAIKKALETAKSHKTLISFDVADPFVVENHQGTFIEVIDQYADIVFANREEAQLLYDATPELACDKICETGATAVIKLGAEGALIGKGDRRIKIRPYPTKVVDTTAAGDMFAAGFLYGQAKGASLEKSGEIAALLAADVISRIGAKISAEAIAKAKEL